MRLLRRFFAACASAICLGGCNGGDYEFVSVSDIGIEYPSPTPLMSIAGDSCGLRYGGSLGGSFGPSFRGTSARDEILQVIGTPVLSENGNVRIGYEDAYGAGYLTYFGEMYAINVYGELSAIDGEWFHRYGFSAWGGVRMRGFSAMAGLGIAAFDLHIRYHEKRYLKHSGDGGWWEHLGSETVSEARNAWMPHVGLQLGIPVFRRARLGLTWTAYYFPDYDFIGVAHFVAPLSLSLTADLGYRARPTLWVSLLENSIDPSFGRFKAGVGLEF